MSRIAAIHQPNFFPWLGYFNKIARSDVFVLLDDVQHQKTGSNWSNRVRLLVSGEPRWVTAPMRRPAHGTARIDEIEWAEGSWREKVRRTIALNYAAAPHFREGMALVEPLLMDQEPRLSAYNIKAITALCGALGLQAQLVPASRFAVQQTSNERLVELVRRVGCDTYLAGGGAQGYQDNLVFEREGISVREQRYVPTEYPQRGVQQFVAGLSVIDALMNCGLAATRALLEAA